MALDQMLKVWRHARRELIIVLVVSSICLIPVGMAIWWW